MAHQGARLTAKVRPGMTFVELHRQMHCLIGEVLADSGLVAMSPEAMVEEREVVALHRALIGQLGANVASSNGNEPNGNPGGRSGILGYSGRSLFSG